MNKMKIKKNNFQIFSFEKKLNKKGVIWEEMADIFIGGFLILLAITGYLLITWSSSVNTSEFFEEKVTDLHHEDVFISYLHTKVQDDKSLSDMIMDAHINDDADELKTVLDGFLTEIYEGKVCWTLLRYDKEDKPITSGLTGMSIQKEYRGKWISENKCKRKEKITMHDSKLELPLPNYEKIYIRLFIEGFAE